MTTEKIMENLLVIADSLDTNERERFEFVRKNNIKKSTFAGAGARLGEFYLAIEEQFRTETAKKSGKSSVKHGMENILKSAKKISTEKYWLHYAYDDDDYQIACNGYMIAALSNGNHVPLAERPDGRRINGDLAIGNGQFRVEVKCRIDLLNFLTYPPLNFI